MVSGNFIIGEDLSLKGFNKYIVPYLEEKGYVVHDKIQLSFGLLKDGILTSISGEGDLEGTVNEMLVELGETVDKKESSLAQKIQGYRRVVLGMDLSKFSHHEGEGDDRVEVNKGKYETIGIYEDDSTASELFPTIAIDYRLDMVETKANEVVEDIKELLDKKLSEL